MKTLNDRGIVKMYNLKKKKGKKKKNQKN